MPRKDYIIELNSKTRILIFFITDAGKIIKFVVKLEVLLNNKWIEIERYDTYHGCVHKDIMKANHEKDRTIRYELMDYKAGLNMAIKDFKENFDLYLGRFFNE